jgi:hypothetical protein
MHSIILLRMESIHPLEINQSAVGTVDLKSFVIGKSLCRQSEIMFYIQLSAENRRCRNSTCPQNNTYTCSTHPLYCLLMLLSKYPFQTPISALLAADIHAPSPAAQMMIDPTRRAMYVYHCCSGKTVSVTYHECVFVDLCI